VARQAQRKDIYCCCGGVILDGLERYRGNEMKMLMIIVVVMMLTGCADNAAFTVTEPAHVYGFWGGLWHGIIIFPNAVMMLFSDDVAIYAPSNNGGFYAFGFVIGALSLAGGSSR